MAEFEFVAEVQEGIPVLRVKGYYERPAGLRVIEEAGGFLQGGKVFLVLDLTACDILSSPGVSTIVELAIDVADNHNGRLILCGLDRLKDKVLRLVGIQTMAEVAGSLEEALQTARRLRGS